VMEGRGLMDNHQAVGKQKSVTRVGAPGRAHCTALCLRADEGLLRAETARTLTPSRRDSSDARRKTPATHQIKAKMVKTP